MIRLSLLAFTLALLAACHCPCQDDNTIGTSTTHAAPVDPSQHSSQAPGTIPAR